MGCRLGSTMKRKFEKGVAWASEVRRMIAAAAAALVPGYSCRSVLGSSPHGPGVIWTHIGPDPDPNRDPIRARAPFGLMWAAFA